jgi:hypothetical protein
MLWAVEATWAGFVCLLLVWLVVVVLPTVAAVDLLQLLAVCCLLLHKEGLLCL